MREIKPNNKNIVVFPSSVLPLQRFGNPPSPEGEGLMGYVYPYPPIVTRKGFLSFATERYAAGRGRPALPTASPRIGHVVISSEVEKSPSLEKRTYEHERADEGVRPYKSVRMTLFNKRPITPSPPLGEGGTSASEANRVANEGNRT